MYCTNILCVHCTKPIVLSFLSFVCASLKGTLCSITSKYIWIYLHQCYFFHVIASLAPSVGQVLKHCQRHNGPRVLRDSTKLPKLGDVIAISNLKLSMTDSVLSPQSSVLSPQSSVLSPQSSVLSPQFWKDLCQKALVSVSLMSMVGRTERKHGWP